MDINNKKTERYNQATQLAIEIIERHPELGSKLCCITGAMAESYGYSSCAQEVIQSLIEQRDEANAEVRILREKLMRRKK